MDNVAGLLRQWGEALTVNAPSILGALQRTETRATAENELQKTIRALLTYNEESALLRDRSPLGDIYVSLPYNNPLYSAVLYSCGPALAGNTVICRPSSQTSSVLHELMEITPPPSDLQVLFSFDPGATFIEAALGKSDCLIFTGTWPNVESLRNSVRQKLIYCGPGMNPFAALPDADIDEAVRTAMRGRLLNSGQDCLSIERIYIHSSIMTEFVDLLLDRLQHLKVSAEPDADIGPLVSSQSARYIGTLLATDYPGRRLLVRGTITGPLVSPSVIVTSQADPIVHAEKFAPIFVLVPFDTPDQLTRYLNDSEYLFGVTIYGHRWIEEIFPHQPHVAINSCLVTLEEQDAHIPFGGCKRSGFVQEADGTCHDGPILFSIETSQEKR